MRLTFLELPVADVERSRDFYVRGFGFVEVAHHEDGPWEDLTLRHPGGVSIRLVLDVERATSLPLDLSFGFTLDTPEAVRDLGERMQADGVELLAHRWMGPRAYFQCTDPDGHRIMMDAGTS